MLTQNAVAWEELFLRFKIPLAATLLGLILIGGGVIVMRSQSEGTKVEVLGATSKPETGATKELIIEISGEVNKPGVYHLPADSRVDDAINSAEGLTGDANKEFLEKSINRAAKLVDGQKIYIPKQSEDTSATSAQTGSGPLGMSNDQYQISNNQININSASQSQLESLWGIGPVTAQKIIEQRPYSTAEELLSKKIVKSNVYERIKNEISVY